MAKLKKRPHAFGPMTTLLIWKTERRWLVTGSQLPSILQQCNTDQIPSMFCLYTENSLTLWTEIVAEFRI